MNNEQLSIIFPVYNEKDSIEMVLQEWKDILDKMSISYRFVICEDGSKDGTKELLQEIKGKYNLLVDSREVRRGYGRAIIDGINAAQSEYIYCTDSDGQHDPKDFVKFWNSKDKADVVVGWRVNRIDALQRKIYSFLFQTVQKTLFPNKLHDPSAVSTIFKKDTIIPYLNYLSYLNEGFWYGFIGMCVKKKLSLYEVPINHRKRIKGDTQVYKFSKVPMIAYRNLIGLIKLKFAK